MAAELADVPLSTRTTLRLGGPARKLIVADTEAEVLEAIGRADDDDQPLLILGGGSNLVVADRGFEGLVVEIATGGIEQRVNGDSVLLTSAAGEDWDELVQRAVADGLVGLEALSGIPGRVGATPIQNVGAYGQEVSHTVMSVRVYDRVTRDVRLMSPADCRFSYRSSVFKGRERYVVLGVTFQLQRDVAGSVVRYAELARVLGVPLGGNVPAIEVRAAVLALRRSKGMVLDASDHDTWSAGSFFTNPILSIADAQRLLPSDAPRWAVGEDRTKVSAAWLIERSGFGKGYGGGAVRLSSKHTLALTNRGDARTSELLALAREIKTGVLNRYGVELVPEPVFVGCSL